MMTVPPPTPSRPDAATAVAYNAYRIAALADADALRATAASFGARPDPTTAHADMRREVRGLLDAAADRLEAYADHCHEIVADVMVGGRS